MSSAKRARTDATSIAPLSETALLSILDTNPAMRQLIIEHLCKDVTPAQVRADEGRFVRNADWIKMAETCMRSNDYKPEEAIKECKRLHLPVPPTALKDLFESECVDRYYSNNGTTQVGKVRRAGDAVKFVQDPNNGDKWFTYLAPVEASIDTVDKYCKDTLKIPPEHIRRGLLGAIQINFRDPSTPAPPKEAPIDIDDD